MSKWLYGNNAAQPIILFCHSAATSATIAINGSANATTPIRTMILANNITAGFIKIPTNDTVAKLFATRGSVAKVEAMPTSKIPITTLIAFERVAHRRYSGIAHNTMPATAINESWNDISNCVPMEVSIRNMSGSLLIICF